MYYITSFQNIFDNSYLGLKLAQIMDKYYSDKNDFNKQNNLITIIYKQG